jgi:AcrR family transcriptional regulator
MPATPRGRRTETAFTEAARQVFAEKGYFNAKISDIAAAAGRSTGSFYNYYTNKEELLEKLSEQFIEDVVSQATMVHHPGDPLENITDAVRAYWQNYRHYLPEMIGIFQLSMTDAAFAKRWFDLRAAGVRTVLEGLRKASRDGAARGLDLEVTASALVSMLQDFCWTWLASGGDDISGPPDDDTAIATMAAVWYRTIYFDASPAGTRPD